MRFVAGRAEFNLDFTEDWPQPYVAKDGSCFGGKLAPIARRKIMQAAKSVLAMVLAASVLTFAPWGERAHWAAAQAHDYKKGDLHIDHPWARPTPPTAQNGALYMAIHNGGKQPDRLTGVKTGLAATAEIHTTLNEDGVMKMRRVENGVEVPAGGGVKFEPGSFHVMLIGLKEPLKEGARHPVTLVFEKAGEVAAEIAVEKGPASGAHQTSGGDAHRHH
jgi:copper(I)-binding protein